MKKLIIFFISMLILNPSAIAVETLKTKLPSGQTVIVKEVHDNPTVIVDTWIKTGSADENDNNNGVAHFLEHLFFRGSENYPDKEFDKIIESKGGLTNAATSKDFTHYYILIPSKDFETAVKLQADMLTKPLIPEEGLKQERNVVIREIERGNDSPQRLLFKNFSNLFYKNSPYRREIIGTKEIISNISRDEIFDFYNKNYSPSDMITVIAGDVNGKDAVNTVSKYFGNNKKSVNKKKKYPTDKKPGNQYEVKDTANVSTTYYLLGFKGPDSAKSRDSLALDIAANILGGGKSSRLYKDLKDGQGIVQGIAASNTSHKNDSVFYINANFEPQNLSEVQNEIIKHIYNLKKGVSEEEVNFAKKQAEKEVLFLRETISNIASDTGYSIIVTDDPNYYDNYLKELKKVTVSDVNKAIKKYIELNHSVTSIVEPKNFDRTKTVTKNTVTTPKEEKLEINSDNFVKYKNHSPKSKDKIGKIDKYILDNGLTLLLDRHENNEIVAISIKTKGGTYTEPIKGTGQIVSRIMLEGTKKYPKNLFDRLTEENRITLYPTIRQETFSIGAKCIKSDLPLMVDMLNDLINNAVVSEENFVKTKNEIMYDIKAVRDNPSNIATEELMTMLWENTPFANTGKVLEKTIPTIKISDVNNYYNNLFDPKNTVVSVNGNVSESDMINCFSEIFRTKGSKTVKYSDYAKDFSDIKENKTVTTYKDSEAAWIFTAWLTDGKTNLKDRITLNVINSILGSGMSSRLFYEIRDKKGLAYSIGSNYTASVNKGSFTVFVGTDPKKADEAEKAIFNEIEKLKTSYVTEKELEDAKNKLKGNYILALETNGDKAENYAVLEITGDGCDFPEKIFSLIDEVTVNDIINAANKYFSRPHTSSKLLPEK